MKIIMKSSWSLFLAACLVLTAPAHAASTTIDFTGTATYVEDAWVTFASGSIGSTVTGSFTYDSGLVPTLNSTTINTFLSNNPGNAGQNWSMSFTLGGLTKTVTQADGLFNFTLNDNNGTVGDRYFVTNNGSVTGNQFTFDLRDPPANGQDAMAPLNGTVPTSAPILSLFGGTKTGRYWETGTTNDLRFNIQSVSLASPVAAIPEPEIYAMLAAGLSFMGFVARRRKVKITAAV